MLMCLATHNTRSWTQNDKDLVLKVRNKDNQG